MIVMQMVTALLLSATFTISLTSLNIYAKELGNNCTTKISPIVSKNLTRLVKSGKQVFNFKVHITDEKIDGFLNPVPLDYFANARHFTWIPDKPDGLVMYKNVPFDFSVRSFNVLDAYIATPSIDIDMNCGKNVNRYDVIYSIFEELKRIVFIDNLQMGESGYMCFFINLSHDMQKNSPYTLLAYRILGIYREILKNYCCKLHKNENQTYEPKFICSGNIIQNTMFVNCANIAGAVLWAIFPLFIRFVSKARLPSYSHNQPQSGNEEVHLRTICTSSSSPESIRQQLATNELTLGTENTSPNSCESNQQESANEEFPLPTEHTSPNSHEPNPQQLPYNEFPSEYALPDKSEWISENHNIYSFSHFLYWLFCFHYSTFFVSRLRRSILTLLSLSIILLDILMYYLFLYETVTVLLHNRIPLGYRSFILGIQKGYELSDGFVLIPFVGIISYIIVNFILFVPPSRLSETIAESTLDEKFNYKFLIKNEKLSKKYGNFNVSTLQGYDRLLAIIKVNAFIVADPYFWKFIFDKWIERMRIKKILTFFHENNIFTKLILFWPLIVTAILFLLFPICELLLRFAYYGIPFIYLIITLPLSYFKKYHLPLNAKTTRAFKCINEIVSLPFLILWAFASSYVFLMSFQIICSYIFSVAIAMLAKPDTVGDIWLAVMFFVHFFTVMNAIQEQYKAILVQSIKFTKTIRPNLVQSKYEEEYINAKLFEVIINKYCPLRYEIGKAIIKLFVIVSFFFACNNIISREDLDLSAIARIALILMTSLIPNVLSRINTKFHFDMSLSHKVINTIYVFQEGDESK